MYDESLFIIPNQENSFIKSPLVAAKGYDDLCNYSVIYVINHTTKIMSDFVNNKKPTNNRG